MDVILSTASALTFLLTSLSERRGDEATAAEITGYVSSLDVGIVGADEDNGEIVLAAVTKETGPLCANALKPPFIGVVVACVGFGPGLPKEDCPKTGAVLD